MNIAFVSCLTLAAANLHWPDDLLTITSDPILEENFFGGVRYFFSLMNSLSFQWFRWVYSWKMLYTFYLQLFTIVI